MNKPRASGGDRETIAFGTPNKLSGPSFVVRFFATGGFDVDLSMQVGPTREFADADELKSFLNSLTETAREVAYITNEHGERLHHKYFSER